MKRFRLSLLFALSMALFLAIVLGYSWHYGSSPIEITEIFFDTEEGVYRFDGNDWDFVPSEPIPSPEIVIEEDDEAVWI